MSAGTGVSLLLIDQDDQEKIEAIREKHPEVDWSCFDLKRGKLSHESLQRTFAALTARIAVEKKGKKKLELERAKLVLMQIIEKACSPSDYTPDEEKKGGWIARILIAALFLIGLPMSFSEGFNDVSSMLAIIPHLPMLAIVIASIFFAGIKCLFYIGFDLREIGNSLRVSILDVPKMVKVYAAQRRVTENISKKLKDSLPGFINASEVADARAKNACLHMFLDDLAVKHEALKEAKKETWLSRICKGLVAAVGIVLYAGAGFFDGTSFVVFMALFLGLSTNPLTFWIGIGVGVVCAVAALVSYFYFEQRGFFRLTSDAFGRPLDLEKKMAKTLPHMNELHHDINFVLEQKEQALTARAAMEDAFTPVSGMPTTTPETQRQQLMIDRAVVRKSLINGVESLIREVNNAMAFIPHYGIMASKLAELQHKAREFNTFCKPDKLQQMETVALIQLRDGLQGFNFTLQKIAALSDGNSLRETRQQFFAPARASKGDLHGSASLSTGTIPAHSVPPYPTDRAARVESMYPL